METQDAPTQPEDASQQAETNGTMPIEELARKGGVAVSLLVLLVAIFFVFASVNDIIDTWLTRRWVPVWRAVFALAVATLSVYVLQRLTR